mmetsp:Transcript_17629/g.49900  ORF Transcript_17629/g.49900 Transcript_17629/m.49900 type:complete len:216 (+) Transcript_17629:7051-7698(+)
MYVSKFIRDQKGGTRKIGENFRFGNFPVVPARKSYGLNVGSMETLPTPPALFPPAPPTPAAMPISTSPEFVVDNATPLVPSPLAGELSAARRISSFSLRSWALRFASSCSRNFLAASSSFEILTGGGTGDLDLAAAAADAVPLFGTGDFDRDADEGCPRLGGTGDLDLAALAAGGTGDLDLAALVAGGTGDLDLAARMVGGTGDMDLVRAAALLA